MAALLAIGFSSTAPAQADMSIEVSLKHRYLTLFENGKVIGKYPIAIGAPESPTIAENLILKAKMLLPFTIRKGR
ncbi:L,D-transpeptidase [Synechococcus sp. AH-558-M21]|nr:L,D-transpeptidase [Synechococcus sp. AH-558-M21]